MDTISKSLRGVAGFFRLTGDDAAEEGEGGVKDLGNVGSHSPSASPDLDSARDIYQDERLPAARSRLEQHHATQRRNESVRAPNPALGFRVAGVMGKPGGGMAWRPVDTIHANTAADGTKPARKHTYAKNERRPPNTPAREGFPGSDRYRSQHPNHTLTTSPSYRATGSPAKRRKIEKPSAVPVHTVEIIDDDDEVASPARRPSTSTPRARSMVSSGSPRSTISRHSGAERKATAQPTSEFTITDRLLDARRNNPRPRKRNKGPSEHRRASLTDNSFLEVGNSPRRQSVDDFDDVEPSQTARSSIFHNHKQGVDCDPRRHSAQRSPEVRSSHFPLGSSPMRINESTKAEAAARKRNGTRGDLTRRSSSSRNLRDFRSAEHASGIPDDAIEDSEDELARTSPVTAKIRRTRSPTKVTPQGGNARQHNDAAGVCYRLRYARTYGLNVTSDELRLIQNKDNPKHFRITDRDSEGNVRTLATIDLTRVNRCKSDNVSRMRLLGANDMDGNRYWFDLQFADHFEHPTFRDKYVAPECIVPIKPSKTDDMEALFQRPFQHNDKVGKSPMVSEEVSAGSAQDGQQAGVKASLVGALLKSTRDSDQGTKAVLGGARQVPRTTQAPLRPVRSTRATAPLHDQELYKEKEIERYSVVHGLGKMWSKPLDYSVDRGFLKRRKATLNYGDLEKLDEGEFLNDSIMTFYMLYLYDELQVSIDRVYFFNTYFFPTLTRKVKGREGINYDDVKSWTKRDDVFSYDYIVVPINENLHWYLAIICNVANINRKYAVEDVQDDVRNLHHATTSLDTSTTPTDATRTLDTEKQGNTSVTLEVAADKEDPEQDDVNLFEEEKKLALIDRDAELADETKQPLEQQDRLDKEAVQKETVTAASLPAQTDPAYFPRSGQAKQASKKKAKPKPGPQKKDPEKPVIMILDSLSATHSNATRALREWLQAEGLEKRAMTVEIDNKAHYPKASQIPMQTNFSDCGLYVLGYLRKFFADPDQFKIKLLQQEMSAQSDWPDMNPSKMRDDIRSLIFRLNDERNGARKERQKAKRTASAQSESAEASPAVRQPDAERSAISTATSVATEVEPVALDEVPAASTEAPRLASPFEEAGSGDMPVLVSGDAQEIHAARDLSPKRQSLKVSADTSPAQPRRLPATRTKSPEVRIPASSPHIDRSAYRRYDGSRDPAEQTTKQSTDSPSPLQSRGPRSNHDGKLRMPSAKKRPSPQPGPSHSPLHTRSGSHDDPITLDDSQDLDAPVKSRPLSTNERPAETIEDDQSQASVREQPSRVEQAHKSAPSHRAIRPHALDRDNSIQEGVGHEWQEQHDVARALRLSLEDKVSTSGPGRAREADAQMDDVFEAGAVYAQEREGKDGKAMMEIQETQETQPMDLDGDDVIPESPAHRTSSPSLDVDMTGS